MPLTVLRDVTERVQPVVVQRFDLVEGGNGIAKEGYLVASFSAATRNWSNANGATAGTLRTTSPSRAWKVGSSELTHTGP